ncbi:MAG: hypothetical protein JXA01_10290 [Dehalococcoidia bacterium]|nr:hypothetical protein [Dehalococcoidia bacterium]
MRYWQKAVYVLLAVSLSICCLSCCSKAVSRSDNTTVSVSFRSSPVEDYKFETGSISVIPEEALLGTFVTVSLPVRNIGRCKNAFIATLYIDGNEYITQDITLAPGNGGSVTYVLSNLRAGTHEISVAGLKSSVKIYTIDRFTISNHQDYQPYYTPLEYTPLPPLPHLSTDHFTPPAVPFFITRIDFRYPFPQSFSIIDSSGKQLYSAENAYQPSMKVPATQVNGDFSIQMQTSQLSADVRSQFFGFNSWKQVVAYYWPEVSAVEGVCKRFVP